MGKHDDGEEGMKRIKNFVIFLLDSRAESDERGNIFAPKKKRKAKEGDK